MNDRGPKQALPARPRRACWVLTWLLSLLLPQAASPQAPAGRATVGPEPPAVAETEVTVLTDAGTPDTGPIATWKGGAVSRAELAGWLRFQRREDEPRHRHDEIETMLLIETMATAAEKRGDGRQPELRSTLASTEENALTAALKSHRGELIAIGDEEVEAFLRRHPDTLKRPRKVRLRGITKRFAVDAGDRDKKALRQRMAEIRAELEAGADFATVAGRESETQGRFHGGLIGNVPAGKLRPEIDEVAMGLEPGELSAVIETDDGLTILECETIIEAREPGAEEVRQGTAAHLRRRRVKQDWADFQTELLRRAGPRYDLAAARRAGADPGKVVARFEGGLLTLGDLSAALRSAPAARNLAALDDEALRRILERLVIQAMSARHARDLGLDQDPELTENLAWQRRQLLAAEELGRRVREQFEPLTEKQIRSYFEAHPESFTRKPHYNLAIIRIDLEEGKERQIYSRAVELRGRLVRGELDFAVAARGHSAHPSAERGGALGWISRRQLAGFGALVLRTTGALAPGQTSELLQRDRSLYVLRLNDRQEARPLTWEEASATAEKRLGDERVAEIQQRIEQRAKAELEVRSTD